MNPSEINYEILTKNEIGRYSRQLVLPEIGVSGQLKLKRASVLIVGAGGLGCPVGIYLASAGIGKIGIVDFDLVEENNLHRQISHTESRVGYFKTQSLCQALRELNSSSEYVPFECKLNSLNALGIIAQFGIIVDASDNVATRYLVNDACVLAKRPLISGSALRFEGQLTVYNYNGGPCYRCLFPEPPAPETVTNCSEGGVLGSIPGVIGCLQSLEVIKLIVGLELSYNKKIFLFDGLSGTTRTVKLRPRQKSCVICGDEPTLTQLIDYEMFCGATASDDAKNINILPHHKRITCEEYSYKYANTSHVLIDVRPKVEFEMCKLDNSTNFPLKELDKKHVLYEVQKVIENSLKVHYTRPFPVFVVCRRGNDSQIAVTKLLHHLKDLPIVLRDLKGGLTDWAGTVDPDFPIY